jgi:hypothetical protein
VDRVRRRAVRRHISSRKNSASYVAARLSSGKNMHQQSSLSRPPHVTDVRSRCRCYRDTICTYVRQSNFSSYRPIKVLSSGVVKKAGMLLFHVTWCDHLLSLDILLFSVGLLILVWLFPNIEGVDNISETREPHKSSK